MINFRTILYAFSLLKRRAHRAIFHVVDHPGPSSPKKQMGGFFFLVIKQLDHKIKTTYFCFSNIFYKGYLLQLHKHQHFSPRLKYVQGKVQRDVTSVYDELLDPGNLVPI